MRNFSPLSIGNSSSCITAVEWEAYVVQNTAGNARRYHSRRQNSSCFHPGNRAEVFIWKIFQPAYRDPYEHIQDLEVRWNLETDSVLSTGFMWRRPKAWFPHHRQDRPDNPSRFKKFRDDPDDWDDLWLPFDRLDRINDKRRGVVSDVFGSDNRIFARVLQTSQTQWWILIGELTSSLVICFSFDFAASTSKKSSTKT